MLGETRECLQGCHLIRANYRSSIVVCWARRLKGIRASVVW
jgi:hypothetical protein